MFNHFVRLLGRHGVLDGIAVFPARVPFEKVPLKDVMSNASFKPGHAYADYQLGDRVSDHGLSDLITAETENGGTISVPMMIAWAGGAVGLAGICIWAVRRRSVRQPVSGGGLVGTNRGGLRPLLASVQGNGSNGRGRRKVFDYQRYYVDLLAQVSDRASEPRVYSFAPNGKASPGAKPEIKLDTNSVEAQLALIESQKKLIEEQQRLIREQARLIEEKTRLIQEKTQVLEKQAELFGNNIF
ncbi:MAG TPA: DUF2167 domain-containing protein [Verrucomicrobiota bacterium]|nr:DUF2167 domain-containing protein [Verrucomicrobiota bacterium]HPU54905.1 DUF2167 domain-containing protein [Verrucomicrobiota bacterium]